MWSRQASTDRSSASPAKISGASARGVPRRHSRTVRGYPDVVVLPGPRSVATSTVSRSTQPSEPLASGRKKPPSSGDTQVRLSRSNSRVTSASEPPCDSATRACRKSGRSTFAPCQTQSWPSAALSASRSSTTSQSGSAVRYDSQVVRRHSPRGCSASRQKLYSRSPTWAASGIFSGESRTSRIASRVAAKAGVAAAPARVSALRSRTQAIARSPSISSSQAYGSAASTGASVMDRQPRPGADPAGGDHVAASCAWRRWLRP